MNKQLIAAACGVLLDPASTGKPLVLIPDGKFKGLDGRPKDSEFWTLTPENGRAIAAALNAQNIDMVLDWEHATMLAKETGAQAPASGWCKQGQFEYVAGVGLCSKEWSWTPSAQSQIEKKEYRYLSPFFLHDKEGFVKVLINASLTNTPNLDVLPEAILAAASKQFFPSTTEEGTDVDLLKALCAKLGLPETATEAEALAAIEPLQAAANGSQKPDLTKYAPIGLVKELQLQVAALQKTNAVGEVEPLIAAALSDGRLHKDRTNQLDYVRALGEQGADAVKAYLDTIPLIPALNGRQAVNPNSPSHEAGLDADTLAVAKQFGHSAEYLKQHGGA